jgi:hypothetical protein
MYPQNNTYCSQLYLYVQTDLDTGATCGVTPLMLWSPKLWPLYMASTNRRWRRYAKRVRM